MRRRGWRGRRGCCLAGRAAFAAGLGWLGPEAAALRLRLMLCSSHCLPCLLVRKANAGALPPPAGARCVTMAATCWPAMAPACAPSTRVGRARAVLAAGRHCLCRGRFKGLWPPPPALWLRHCSAPARCCPRCTLAAKELPRSACSPSRLALLALPLLPLRAAACAAGQGSECNLLDLPADLAELLSTTNDTFRCPNCLAGVQQVGAGRAAGWRGGGRSTASGCEWPDLCVRFGCCLPGLLPRLCFRLRLSCTSMHRLQRACLPWPQCFVCKKEGEENKDVFK